MDKQEQVLAEVRDVLNKMASLNRRVMEEQHRGYKSSEVHCIEYIGKHADPNVTKLATAFYMTRGAISKLTKKLVNKNVIAVYQKAENKKEIYFKLTPQGEKIFNIHEKLHRQFRERDQAVFEYLSEEQVAQTLQFIKLYSNHLDREIAKQTEL